MDRIAPINKLSVALVMILTVLLFGNPLTWMVAVGVFLT
jgi:uncharacterized membrane protein